ncbi:MAG: UvrD-helicase domain-containing protein [Fimbriimonadaceae bacterium]|nr:MAG: UvrD-helicase domain-containing protein [Fimbriimonadaceae bacterium]
MSTIPLDLDTLNPRQHEAVVHEGGPVMIIAGAGSGKTRVITYRIARLIQEGTPPWRILAVTFTNKAAKEMRERIEHLVGDQAKDIWMGTFHSLCARLLRMDGMAIGLDRNFVIYDDSEQVSLAKDIIKKRGFDDKAIQPRSVLGEISRAKEQLLSPEKYEERASSFFERTVSGIYKDYQKRLTAANALDFDDLLFKAVRLMDESQVVREKYQDKFLHVLVDEYQDVNLSQYRLADLLSSKHRNLTVVGDDDQSIYGWRGADVSLMMRFSVDHPDANLITLDQNYRSTQNILKGAHSVVRHNRTRNDKKLWTDNGSGELISIGETGTENDEARLVVDTIMREVRTGRRSYGDFAVLYRTNAQSRAIEEAFLGHQVPHILVGGTRFYDRKEIKDMVAYLRVIWNSADEISLRRVINTPARAIGPGAITKAEQFAESQGISLFDAFASPTFEQELTKKTVQGIRNFTKTIEDGIELAEPGPITPVLKHVMQASGYLDELRADRTEEAQARLENLQELVNVTAQYDTDPANEVNLGSFLETVALVSDIDTMKGNGDGVKLMTLHSSKGLEFPAVFLMGLEEGVFPHSRALGSDSELEEERRLCYVGMTRAREALYLTYAQRRSQYGQANFNPRSRFIDDLPREIVDQMPGTTMSAQSFSRPSGTPRLEPLRTGGYAVAEEPREKSAGWTPPFTVGQKVSHRKFGIGIVVACAPLKNDAEVTVAFPGATGIKKMVQSLAKLESV